MRGGKLTCSRKHPDNNSDSITLSCVDYKNKIFNSFDKIASVTTGWVEYYDEQLKSKYWYNWDTGEATWLPPSPTPTPSPTLSPTPTPTPTPTPNSGGKRKLRTKRRKPRKKGRKTRIIKQTK